MTLERAKQIIQENFGDKYDVEFSLSPANIQQQVQPDNSPKMREECGEYPADLPSNLCCGCDAYKEHLS